MSALTDFLSVQVPNEKLIRDDLRAAASEVSKVIRKTARNPRSSAANVRIAQYRLALSEIRAILRELWNEELSPRITQGIADAAGEAGAIDVLNDLVSENAGFSVAAWENLNRQVAKNNVTAYRQRVEGASYRPLAVSVYRNAALANGLVDRTVNVALLTGKSARELADSVRSLIDPDVRGGISYAAMRLGRTELNNAFHATTIEQHGKAPWVTRMRWNLSASHTRPDQCNDLEGDYLPEDVPGKPHPQCFCYVTPETISEKSFIRNYKSGNYDAYIDSIMSEGS